MSNRRRIQPPPRLLRAGAIQLGGPIPVRNVATGRVLPCHLAECDRDGDDRFRIETPHEDPLWPGQLSIRIFCSITHRDMYADTLPRARFVAG